jgi:hypothetical protein
LPATTGRSLCGPLNASPRAQQGLRSVARSAMPLALDQVCNRRLAARAHSATGFKVRCPSIGSRLSRSSLATRPVPSHLSARRCLRLLRERRQPRLSPWGEFCSRLHSVPHPTGCGRRRSHPRAFRYLASSPARAGLMAARYVWVARRTSSGQNERTTPLRFDTVGSVLGVNRGSNGRG